MSTWSQLAKLPVDRTTASPGHGDQLLERCSEFVERPATVLEVHVGPEQDEVLGVFEQAGAEERRRLLELSGPAKGVGLHLPCVRIAVLLAPFPPGFCGPVLVASLAAQTCEHAEQVPVGPVPAAPAPNQDLHLAFPLAGRGRQPRAIVAHGTGAPRESER